MEIFATKLAQRGFADREGLMRFACDVVEKHDLKPGQLMSATKGILTFITQCWPHNQVTVSGVGEVLDDEHSPIYFIGRAGKKDDDEQVIYDSKTGEVLDIDPKVFWKALHDQIAFPYRASPKQEN